MSKPAHSINTAVLPLTGDLHLQSLAEQVGSAVGLAGGEAMVAELPVGRINSLAALADFLVDYQATRLIPLELPAIVRAQILTSAGKSRELTALDRELSREPALREFAAASGLAGQRQLRRLRPVRDHRVVQRYLHAVENGEAHGWHTVTYGLTLAVFSLPLRPGLSHYARQTIWGFIQPARRTVEFSEAEGHQLLAALSLTWPRAIEAALTAIPRP
jgi:urease accessory protein UreF